MNRFSELKKTRSSSRFWGGLGRCQLETIVFNNFLGSIRKNNLLLP